MHNTGHTLRGCVDWNYWCNPTQIWNISHTLRGCVDWNVYILWHFYGGYGHTLRGCVDWNYLPECLGLQHIVTPCVGVWIETEIEELSAEREKVTPCVGVWIETIPKRAYKNLRMSHPAWVCGLKQRRLLCKDIGSVSHPAWVCGLKLPQMRLQYLFVVTPCVGVWIETSIIKSCCPLTTSHPAWVCGLKPFWRWRSDTERCHTLRGCVDWNL